MADPIARVKHEFNESIQTKAQSVDILAALVTKAGQVMLDALQQGHKILTCGNGGSASDAQHFSAELINRYYREREPLACLCLNTDTSTLTSVANDYIYDQIFSKQIIALGQLDDVLFAISTSGNSRNIIEAVDAAHARQMKVVALTGHEGGQLGTLLRDDDIHICVPSTVTARIQEVHILVIHCLCDFIDNALLGEESA